MAEKNSILVTGATGLIGTYLIEGLVKEFNNRIILLCRGQPEKVSCSKDGQVEVFYGDVCDETFVSRLFMEKNPAITVHLAALTGVETCESRAHEAFRTNALGTYNVVRACCECKAKLIFTSSREVYGEVVQGFADENYPLAPKNVYGLTKMLSENIILWSHKFKGLKFNILRLTNIYGLHSHLRGLTIIFKKVTDGDEIVVHGGEQNLNPLYVKDAVSAIKLAIENDAVDNEIFNIGSNEHLTLNEIVKIISKACNRNPEIKFQGYRDMDVRAFRVSIDKAKRKLGYEPRYRFEQVIRDWAKTGIVKSDHYRP